VCLKWFFGTNGEMEEKRNLFGFSFKFVMLGVLQVGLKWLSLEKMMKRDSAVGFFTHSHCLPNQNRGMKMR